ncbi:MAG: SUMF1/EgtB/PvdO family nonheme iron enzyme [Kiritimatiellia bacterium]|nr:SUMF1/EgtB/PvdO family nonheme iron enzyme [Kiritimatiellia bacterium]
MQNNIGALTAIVILAFQGIGFSQTNPVSSLVQIPGGTFIMGDVNDTFSNPHHSNDQVPLHLVELDGFSMGKTEIKSAWYCGFLNAEILAGAIQVVSNYVVKAGTNITYCDVYDPASNTRSLFLGWQSVFCP